jgi:O-antigen ligase
VWPWLGSALCAVLVWLVGPRPGVRVVAVSWLAAAVFSAVIGLCQYVGVAHYFAFMNVAEVGQAFANLRQRNQFATLTSIGLLALLWLLVPFFGARAGQRAGAGQWLVACVLVGVLALGNAASGSRTGLVQWLVVAVLLVVWRRQGVWRAAGMGRLAGWAVAALVVYFVAALALPVLLQALTGSVHGGLAQRLVEGAGCESRLVMWSNVLHLIAQKPWLGWGWGELDYAHFVTLYPGERFCDILDNAHNLPLHLAVELGVPLAVVLCGAGLWLVWLARPWRETDPARQLAWGVLAVVLLHSMVEYPLWYGPFQLAFGLCVWLLAADLRGGAGGASGRWGPGQRRPGQRRPGGAAWAAVWPVLVAVVLVLPVGYAAWDYHRVSQIYLAPEARDAAYRDNTLGKLQGSRLFADEVRFAELTMTPVGPENAARLNALAHRVLHFSPEARVVQRLVESAAMLGRTDEVLFFTGRFRAAYPQAYARWSGGGGAGGEGED